MARRKATVLIDLETGQAEAALKDLGGGFSQLERRSAGEIRDIQRAMDRLGDSTQRTSRRGGNFNEVLFSMGDGLQDAQYGLNGVANNLSFTAEMFAQGVQDAGGFKGAMKGIGASLMGVGGLVLGLQALLIVAPKIIDFFSESAEEAEEMAKRVMEVVDSMAQFKFSVNGVIVTESNLNQVMRNAKESLATLRIQYQSQKRTVDELRASVEGLRIARARSLRGNLLDERFEEAAQQLQAEHEILSTLEHRISVREGEVQTLTEKEQKLQDSVEAQRRWTEWGAMTADEFERMRDASGEVVRNLERAPISEIADPAEGGHFGRQLPAPGTPPPIKNWGTTGGVVVDQTLLQIHQLTRAINLGLVPAQEAAAQKAGILRQSLRQMLQQGVKPTHPAFLRMHGALLQAEAQMGQMEQAAQSYSEAQQVAMQLTQEIATMQIRSAADAANAIINSVKRIIVAKLAELVAKGVASLGPLALIAGPAMAVGLRALFDNLVPQFAAGTDAYPGGVGLVGEAGPELVALPERSAVINNENTECIVASMAARPPAGRGVDFGPVVTKLDSVERRITEQTSRLEAVERVVDVRRADTALVEFRRQEAAIGVE